MKSIYIIAPHNRTPFASFATSVQTLFPRQKGSGDFRNLSAFRAVPPRNRVAHVSGAVIGSRNMRDTFIILCLLFSVLRVLSLVLQAGGETFFHLASPTLRDGHPRAAIPFRAFRVFRRDIYSAPFLATNMTTRLQLHFNLLATLAAVLLSTATAFAQMSSNDSPPDTSLGIPSLTNVTEELPPVGTNSIPSILPRPPFVPGGSTVRSAFSGKFVVPGRSLRMPAPEAENDSRTPSDWNRAITFGMNMTDGNSDTLRYALGLDAAKERKQDTTRIRARAAYGESENQKDTEYATALYRYDRQLSHRFYVLGNADWFTDTIADVDYRLIGIISPGFHLWRSDSTVGKLELGAGYLAEEKGSGQDAFAAGRAAGALERIINAHILTWASIEYLPKLTDSTVFYINSELGLAAMLTRDLNLNLTFEDRYDNTPATDKNSNDLAFTTSLSLKF